MHVVEGRGWVQRWMVGGWVGEQLRAWMSVRVDGRAAGDERMTGTQRDRKQACGGTGGSALSEVPLVGTFVWRTNNPEGLSFSAGDSYEVRERTSESPGSHKGFSSLRWAWNASMVWESWV